MKGRTPPPPYEVQYTEDIGYRVVWVPSLTPATEQGYATKREAIAAVFSKHKKPATT